MDQALGISCESQRLSAERNGWFHRWIFDSKMLTINLFRKILGACFRFLFRKKGCEFWEVWKTYFCKWPFPLAIPKGYLPECSRTLYELSMFVIRDDPPSLPMWWKYETSWFMAPKWHCHDGLPEWLWFCCIYFFGLGKPGEEQAQCELQWVKRCVFQEGGVGSVFWKILISNSFALWFHSFL